MNGYRILL